MLSRLASPIAAVSGLIGGTAESGKPAAASAPAGTDPSAYADEEIALTLEQFLEQQGGRFSVKLHVVSLVEFREAVGDRWRKLRDKVMMIAEATINKHLGQGNMASRQGEDLFVLVFPKLPEDQGRHRAFVIAKELGARLLGNSRFAAGEEPLVHVAALDPDEAIGPDGKLNLAALESAIATVRVDAPRGQPQQDLPAYLRGGGGAADEEGGLRAHLRPGEAASGEEQGLRAHLKPGEGPAAEEGPQELRYHMKPGEAPPAAAEAGLRRSLMPSQPSGEADAAEPEPPKPVAPPKPRLLPEHLTMAYRPGWVAAGESISAYLAQVQRHDKGKPATGERAFLGASGEEVAMMDCFAAKAVAAQLVAMRQKITLILPVHASSLAGPPLRDLRAILATVPHPVRILRLVIEVCGLPADGAHAAGLIQHIKEECREVVLRTGFQSLAGGLEATMAGLDLSMISAADRADDRLLSALAAFRDKAGQCGYLPYVWGLPSRAALNAAVAGDFAMVNGPALIKDVPEPNRLIPVPKAKLLG